MTLNINAICQTIGISNFQRKDLLEIALTHRSFTNEQSHLTRQQQVQQERDYRRMALLGDAILGAVVTDYLYRRFPTLDVDAISSLKSKQLVTKNRLSEFAESLLLRELSQLGGSATEIDKTKQNRFLSETFEALFAAIYLEFNRDFNRAGEWLIDRFIAPSINENFSHYQQFLASEIEYRRQVLLGNDILGAIVIDYLYHRFPERPQDKLTQWKSKLVDKKEIFTKDIKAHLATVYLNFERDFPRTRDWVIEKFLVAAVKDLLTDELRSEQNFAGANSMELAQLVSHIGDKTRRDDFLHLANAMKPADELMMLMKQQLDTLAAENSKLQELLHWINQKSFSANVSSKPAAIRAFYLGIIRVLGLAFINTLDPSINLNGAKARNLYRYFDRAKSLSNSPEITLALNLSQGFDPTGIIACIFAFSIEPKLKLALQKFQSDLPNPNKNLELFQEWRRDNGQAWIARFKAAIGHDLQFTNPEKEQLKQYYYVHHLLVECLNNENCEVTTTVRQKIEDTLLLIDN